MCCGDAMDPISAISLASNIIQLVDFGLKLSKTCCEIYQTGLSAANTDLKNDALSLQSLGAAVEASVQRSANPGHLGKGLQDSAKRCAVAAGNLQAAISKLETTAGDKRSAVGRMVKTLWRKNEIGRLQDRLERERALLDGNLLIELRSASGS